jgi:hypothetical protein
MKDLNIPRETELLALARLDNCDIGAASSIPFGEGHNAPQKSRNKTGSVSERTVVSEPKPPDGTSFAEHDSIQLAILSPGDATVALTGNETIDLTGISLSGRKEIIFNGLTLSM